MLSHTRELAQRTYIPEGGVASPEPPVSECTEAINALVGRAAFPPGDATPLGSIEAGLAVGIVMGIVIAMRHVRVTIRISVTIKGRAR